MNAVPSAELTHEVIQSIVTLTEQRDQRSLEQSLLSTLKEMLKNAQGWLLNIPADAESLSECTMLHGVEATLPTEIFKRGCDLARSDNLNFIRIGSRTYLLFKLLDAENDRVHLLVLAQTDWPPEEQQLVLGMVRVYQNFVSLISDSEKDTLTGLYNRRKLETKLQEFDNSRQQGRQQKDKAQGDYLAIMDLDRFKHVNDTFGHLIGDDVLLTFANILRLVLRDGDMIFRYGGEEFVALLQDAPHNSIEDVLERMRRNVEAHDFPLVGRVTVSIGFACLDGRTSPLDVMEKADRALYFAKDNGRNQVREFDQLVGQHLLEDVHRDGGIELF